MILVNCDSWTGGWYSKTPEFGRFWADHLQDKIDNKIVNIGLEASSNNRIFRTTIEYLQKEPTPAYVIIGWSWLERFELPYCNGDYLRLTPQGASLSKLHQEENVLDRSVSNTLLKIFYSNLYNQSQARKTFLSNLLILQDLCAYKNIKLLNFQSFRSNFDNIENDNENYYLYKQLNLNNWILSNDHRTPTTMDLMLTNEGYQKGMIDKGHTDAAGMQRWSEIIYNFIKLR